MIRLLLIVFTLWSSAASSQTSNDLGSLLRSMHLNPAFRQDLRERGYTGDKFEVMINHTRQLYADKAITAGLSNKIEAGLRTSGNKVGPAFFKRLDHALRQAYSVGLSRLSAAERRRLFTTNFGFIKAMPSRDCTSLVTGKMRPERSQKLFDSYMVQLPTRQLADFHMLSRKATRLGLARGAVPRNLSATDIRRAEEALMPMVDSMISKQKNAKSLYRAWAGNVSAQKKYSCAFNKIFGASALSLPRKSGDLAISLLMAQ